MKSCRNNLARLAIAAASLAFAACSTSPVRESVPAGETLLSGETMGSAWTVKIAGPLPASAESLRAGVQDRFELVNQALSTYRADSALSRFNADDSGQWQSVDAELATVMGYALSLAERSGGAYDISVGPLVDLWGFGPDPRRESAPDAAAIEAARSRVGWRRVSVDTTAQRARKEPGVRLDLSSLGKGHGVDRVAEYLDEQGVTDYLIDLSGKLRARGRNARGESWRVAVEQPAADDPSGAARAMPAVVTLRDASIATSGDYRRYFESRGRHYSHIIDPRTGWPVNHATLSATARAGTCMQADALATVFMVMAPGDALRLADELATPALLISRDAAGYRMARSAGWREN